MELDDPVCYCFHISKRKVLNYLRVHRPRVASELSGCGGAGTGCGWCISTLKRYFETTRRGEETADSLSRSQYEAERAAYIRAGKGKPAPGAIPLPDATPDGQ
ncbi:MAG TPA: (2Fe-2S)-binding protein [Caulifigura sp.]|jgi:NAD(P)H-nitrite reductase large subunit|nr:(2Fe-2S)-binding protein [Caulifigura sp.]